MDVTQCCILAAKCVNLHSCAVWSEGRGNVCKVYEYSVRERGGSKGTVVWGSDSVPCAMNTDFRNDADSICYICSEMYAMYPNKSMLVIKIPPWTWISICCECCVWSGRGLCLDLIPCLEESYWLWCVVVCDLETSWIKRSWPTEGSWVKRIRSRGRRRKKNRKELILTSFKRVNQRVVEFLISGWTLLFSINPSISYRLSSWSLAHLTEKGLSWIKVGCTEWRWFSYILVCWNVWTWVVVNEGELFCVKLVVLTDGGLFLARGEL